MIKDAKIYNAKMAKDPKAIASAKKINDEIKAKKASRAKMRAEHPDFWEEVLYNLERDKNTGSGMAKKHK